MIETIAPPKIAAPALDESVICTASCGVLLCPRRSLAQGTQADTLRRHDFSEDCAAWSDSFVLTTDLTELDRVLIREQVVTPYLIRVRK